MLNLCVEVLIVHDGNKMCLLRGEALPYTNYLRRTPDMAVVWTMFNVLRYDAVLGQNWNLSTSRHTT